MTGQAPNWTAANAGGVHGGYDLTDEQREAEAAEWKRRATLAPAEARRGLRSAWLLQAREGVTPGRPERRVLPTGEMPWVGQEVTS